jgi:hypothetical protein
VSAPSSETADEHPSSKVPIERNTKALGELAAGSPEQIEGLRGYRDMLAGALHALTDDFHLNFQLAGVCERLAQIARAVDPDEEEHELKVAEACYARLLQNGTANEGWNRQYGLRFRYAEVRARLVAIADDRGRVDPTQAWNEVDSTYARLTAGRTKRGGLVVPPGINEVDASLAESTRRVEAQIRGGTMLNTAEVVARVQAIDVLAERASSTYAVDGAPRIPALAADAIDALTAALEVGSPAQRRRSDPLRGRGPDPGTTPPLIVEGNEEAAWSQAIDIARRLNRNALDTGSESVSSASPTPRERVVEAVAWDGKLVGQRSTPVEAIAIGARFGVLGRADGRVELWREGLGRAGAISVLPRASESTTNPMAPNPSTATGGPEPADEADPNEAMPAAPLPYDHGLLGSTEPGQEAIQPQSNGPVFKAMAVSGEAIGVLTTGGYAWFGTVRAGLCCYSNLATSVAAAGGLPDSIVFGRNDATLLVIAERPYARPAAEDAADIVPVVAVSEWVVPVGHFGVVAVAPWSRGIAAATHDGLLTWFDATKPDSAGALPMFGRVSEVTPALGPSPGAVSLLASSGDLVASAATDGEVTLWNRGVPRARMVVDPPIEALAMDDGTVVVAAGGAVSVHETTRLTLQRILDATAPVAAGAGVLVAAGHDVGLRIWNRLPLEPKTGTWVGLDVIDGVATLPVAVPAASSDPSESAEPPKEPTDPE